MLGSAVPTVSRRELESAVRTGRITLVDVLSPESFAAAHLPGAINVPVREVRARAAAMFPDRGAPIVTYCGGPT